MARWSRNRWNEGSWELGPKVLELNGAERNGKHRIQDDRKGRCLLDVYMSLVVKGFKDLSCRDTACRVPTAATSLICAGRACLREGRTNKTRPQVNAARHVVRLSWKRWALPAVDQQAERARDDRWTPARFILGGCRGRSEIRGHGVYVVVSQVERHGARSLLGGDRLDRGVLVRGVFVDDRDRAIAAGSEHQLGSRVKVRCIDSLADGPTGNDLAVGIVHRLQHSAAAAGKDPLMSEIDG